MYLLPSDVLPLGVSDPLREKIAAEIDDPHPRHVLAEIRAGGETVEIAFPVMDEREIKLFEARKLVSLFQRRASLRGKSQEAVDVGFGQARVGYRMARERGGLVRPAEIDRRIRHDAHLVGGEKRFAGGVVRLPPQVPHRNLVHGGIVCRERRYDAVVVGGEADRLAHRLAASAGAAAEIRPVAGAPVERLHDLLAVDGHEVRRAPVVVAPDVLRPYPGIRLSAIGDHPRAEIGGDSGGARRRVRRERRQCAAVAAVALPPHAPIPHFRRRKFRAAADVTSRFGLQHEIDADEHSLLVRSLFVFLYRRPHLERIGGLGRAALEDRHVRDGAYAVGNGPYLAEESRVDARSGGGHGQKRHGANDTQCFHGVSVPNHASKNVCKTKNNLNEPTASATGRYRLHSRGETPMIRLKIVAKCCGDGNRYRLAIDAMLDLGLTRSARAFFTRTSRR